MSGPSTVLRISLLLAACAVILVSSDIGKEITCCTKVNKSKQNSNMIVKYEIQKESSHCVNAIIFTLHDGTSRCSDPKAKWVTLKMKELDRKKRSAVPSNRR
ncbi:hypothetical protein NDU88_001998 [Pleurodeles waltl]|uniref:Chemokine interleukin-8-like domain-containing protein n=2 Tax=Pleurodeles waltl TaxID=8319 RepID=A0AAV7LJ24_PLEWA|nr:hypothetical protein NDU88_001998 [Pleurodeles waltl]